MNLNIVVIDNKKKEEPCKKDASTNGHGGKKVNNVKKLEVALAL